MGVTILIHLFHNQKRGMLMGTCCSISWETPSQVCLPTCLPAINFSRSGSLLGLEAHTVHKEYSGEFYCAQNVYNVHRTCLITNNKSYFFSRGNVVNISPYSAYRVFWRFLLCTKRIYCAENASSNKSIFRIDNVEYFVHIEPYCAQRVLWSTNL